MEIDTILLADTIINNVCPLAIRTPMLHACKSKHFSNSAIFKTNACPSYFCKNAIYFRFALACFSMLVIYRLSIFFLAIA